VLYLSAYPFECSEQLASRTLAISSLRDVLVAFQARDLPSPEALNAAVARDIDRLRGMQNADGGFPSWRRGDPSWPYHSIHVAHALAVARQKDYAVPQEMVTAALKYLRNIERSIPKEYGAAARRSLIAYALVVRQKLGDADLGRGRQLAGEGLADTSSAGRLTPEAAGWLLALLGGDPASQSETAALRRYLMNRVVETAGAASFTTDYGDDAYLVLATDRRADAIVLDALIGSEPGNDLIPKLVQGLLGHRTAGHWGNTQENSFVLLALDRYFATFERQTPNFVTNIWLGGRYLGGSAFQGRSTERAELTVPMSFLAASGQPQSLQLEKLGDGRLYYRLGLQYAPLDLNLPAASAGFTVERIYEAVDDAGDVQRDANGTWHVRAGARVRVVLTMVAESRRYHVALVDRLPAGIEVLNPELAVVSAAQASAPMTPASVGTATTLAGSWWRWRQWYEHQNLRDDRVEAFTSLLWPGIYTYSYLARATTPGEFFAPPAKAEEMYAPETFGRSATDQVVVR
jgi:alpha-2-macroglobulin